MPSYAEELPKGGDPRHAPSRRPKSVRCSRRAFLRWSARLVAASPLVSCVRGAEPADGAGPSVSRAAREEAVKELPLKYLQESMRARIEEIVAKPTIYRRLPIEVIPCDPELYLFLVRYPEVVVNMWQLMGVTNAQIKRTGVYAYDAADGAGTQSKVELLYGTREKHLFLAEGYYDGPILPRRITGRCVLLLSTAYSRDAQQRSYVSNQLDVFLQLDRAGIELVAKTLHPLMGKTIDTNFTESARFISQLSHAAQTNGAGVQVLVTRLTNIDPDVRLRFAQLTTNVHQRAALQRLDNWGDAPAPRVSELETNLANENAPERH